MQDLVTDSNERASGIAKDALWSILSLEQGAWRWLFNTWAAPWPGTKKKQAGTGGVRFSQSCLVAMDSKCAMAR